MDIKKNSSKLRVFVSTAKRLPVKEAEAALRDA